MKAGSLHRVPLHQQVTKRLRVRITKELTPGQRLESETALALRFSVSVRTIREALSALAHEGLVERRHGSGSFVTERRPTQHVALWMAIDEQFPRVSYWSASVLSSLPR